MNPLVAANSQTHLPLAQNLLKFLAAVFVAACCLVGSAFAAGTKSVSLAWDRNPETDIAGYRLQYGLTQGSYPNVIDAGNAISATVTGLNQGTTYYFTVVAYNTAGQTSPASSVVTHTVPGEPNTAPTANSFSLTVVEDTPTAATASGTDGEGDTLTYAVVTAPTKGTLTGTAPNWTYTPVSNATGSDSFTYRANDGVLNSANATVSITITPVSDAPVADSKNLTVQEDGTLAITLSGSDADGDALTYALVSAPSKGTLIGTAPNLTYTPGANLFGSDSFTYRVNDGTTNSATATVSITISSVNDIPVANGQSLTTVEDTPLGITLSGSDVESTSLTYSITTAPTKGTLSGTAPNLTYTPAANSNGADSFAFRVNDGSANSPTATVSISVTAVNDAPVATPRTLVTTPNTALAVTLAGTDVESSPLTYAIASSPANGLLSGTAPNLTYTPNSNFEGTDSFNYRVNDGTLDSATATVSISVSVVNLAPIANAQSLTVAEDTQLFITLTGSDPESKPLTYTIVNQTTKGVIDGVAPNLIYTPAANFNGSDSLTFRVNDGTLNSTTATISITVTPVNDAPVAVARSYSTTSGTALAVTLVGSDPEASALQYNVVSFPSNGSLSGTGPNRTYTANAGFSGTDTFTYRVNDGALDSATATVSIAVTAVNLAPIANAQNLGVDEDTQLFIRLTGSDPEGGPLTYSIVSQTTKGVVEGVAPNLTYTPSANFSGSDSLTFRVNDGALNSTTATISIMVMPVNDAPVAMSRTYSTNSGTPLAVILAGNDPEGSPMQYSVVSFPSNGSLTGTAPNLTYTSNANFSGADSFTYRVNDGSLNSTTATVTIAVSSSNRPPQAHTKSASTMKGKAVAVTLSGSDADADALSFRIVNGPVDGTLTGTPPNVTYTPVAKWTGEDRFTYVANDGKMDSPVATVALKVKAGNKKPVATKRSATVNQNSSGTITLTGSDPDGDSLTFAVVKQPANGSIVGTSPNFVYVPKSGFKGKDTFTFAANDGTVNSAPALVEINVVNPNNRAPFATALNLRGAAKAVVPVTLTGFDFDGDPLTFRITSKPTIGKLTGKGSSFKYKPAANFSGVITFTYVANDGSQESPPTLVTITIDPATARVRSIADKSKDAPQIAPSRAVSGPHTTRVMLALTGPPGQRCTLQHSTNLTIWTDLQQVDIPGTGIYTFEVSPPEGSPCGFFRLEYPD